MILLPVKLWPARFKYSLGFQLSELTGKNKTSILNSLCWNFMPITNCSQRSAPKVIRKRMFIWGAILSREKAAPWPWVLHPTVPAELHGSFPHDNIWRRNFKAMSQLWNGSLRVKDDSLEGPVVFSSTAWQNNRFRYCNTMLAKFKYWPAAKH